MNRSKIAIAPLNWGQSYHGRGALVGVELVTRVTCLPEEREV